MTAVQLHAILHYSEVWDLRETAMSFRFSSWTKVSLILLASHPFWTAFCDKKVPWGLGKSAKREGVLENLFLGSLFSRVLGDSIACNPYRLRYWNLTPFPGAITSSRIACNPYRLRYFFYFSVRFFQTAAFFFAEWIYRKKKFRGGIAMCVIYMI